MVCIGHEHYVYGNRKEIEEYRAVRDRGEPIKSVTIRGVNAPEDAGEGVEQQIIPHVEITTPVHDTGSVWYTILSFLLPLLGLAGAAVFRHFHFYQNYKACRKGALWGFAVLLAVIVIFLIFIGLALL